MIDQFTEADRAVYEYRLPDGTPKYGDPLALKRRLNRLLGGETAKVVADFNGDDDAAAELAARRLAAAVCDVFELPPPFDPATGKGVVQAVWLGIFNAFQAFLSDAKKKPADGPTTSPPSEGATPPA